MHLSNRTRPIVPKNLILPLAIVFIYNLVVYYGARLVTSGAVHYDLTLPIDASIPFVPWTVCFYLLCFVFWVVNFYLATKLPEDEAWHLFASDFLSRTVCLAVFIILPTAVVRPEVGHGTFWQFALNCVYYFDTPDMLFPSIHCMASWTCWIAVRKNPAVPKWYGLFSLLFVILICISTLTTKQHVFIDSIAGIALSELCWQLTKLIPFPKLYRKILELPAKRRKRD